MIILQAAIKTKPGSEGDIVYNLIKTTIDKEGGYRLGHFKRAYAALKERFESKKLVVLQKMKEKYYHIKMK